MFTATSMEEEIRETAVPFLRREWERRTGIHSIPFAIEEELVVALIEGRRGGERSLAELSRTEWQDEATRVFEEWMG